MLVSDLVIAMFLAPHKGHSMLGASLVGAQQPESAEGHGPRCRYRDRRAYDYPPPPGSGANGYGRGGPPPPAAEEAYGSSGGDGGGGGGDPNGGGERPPMDNFTKAVIAGAFIMGMGTGVWFNSEATFYPSNVASTEVIDRHTPSSEVCMANGYSSMVFDERVFVSFNPCALLHPLQLGIPAGHAPSSCTAALRWPFQLCCRTFIADREAILKRTS